MTLTPQPPISMVQHLRGLAALMVVFHHAVQPRSGFFSPLAHTDFGQIGVMVFFVLSGFIMVHACRTQAPLTFVRRRLIRVVPLYWLMTLVYFAILFRVDLVAGEPWRRLPSLGASLLFLPKHHIGTPEAIWPVLVQGWTLNFEMLFYAIFALGIALGRPALFATATVLGLVALGVLIDGGSAVFVTWTSPLMLLFVAGMAIAYVHAHRSMSPVRVLLPVAALAALGLALSGAAATSGAPAYLAATGLVLGALGWQERRATGPLPLLGRLGDASYSVYLSHTLFLIALFPLLRLVPLSDWAQFLFVTPVAVLAVTWLGFVVHDRLERPITRALRLRFDPPPASHGPLPKLPA